jgi:hypothetical protein
MHTFNPTADQAERLIASVDTLAKKWSRKPPAKRANATPQPSPASYC